MSGGVDSSVVALLLKQATPNNFEKLFGRPAPKGFRGYDVVGVFMRCWSQGSSDALGVGAPCSVEQDAEDARRVAEHIGIPFYVWDFEEEYKKRVVDYMVEGYRSGITPNPDVMCNREIKFGLFFKKALKMGADYVATGHYVRREPEFSSPNFQFSKKFDSPPSLKIINYKLKIARDTSKDQSYFLWTLTQKQLARCLFPIGEYQKPEVRAIARKAGLPTAEKKDSQGICFLGKVTIADFLAAYIPGRPGKVLTTAGKEIGTHRGAEFYTIGQRHIGVASRAPIYVVEKNVKANTLIVAENEKDEALYKKEVSLANVNIISPGSYSLIRANPTRNKISNGASKRIDVMARVRYRQPLSAAVLTTYDKKPTTHNKKILSGETSRKLSVVGAALLVFKKPQKFVAAGQSAVFYLPAEALAKEGAKSLEMLGGGVIT